MRERRNLGAGVLLVGLWLMGLSQLVASTATAPLFDGLVVEEPYRFVAPPPDGAGDPFAASAVQLVVEGAAPLVAVATAETPPQAQIIAQADAFVMADGTTGVTVSIQPSASSDAEVAGNIYRFTVTDQAGAPLDIVLGAVVTVVLRAPQPDPGAIVAHLDGGRWVPLPTQQGGLPDLFAANVDQLGDFAVLIPGAAPSASGPAPSATVAAPSPSSSGRSGGPKTDGGTPTWIIALFAIAAVGIGLSWGLLGGGGENE